MMKFEALGINKRQIDDAPLNDDQLRIDFKKTDLIGEKNRLTHKQTDTHTHICT